MMADEKLVELLKSGVDRWNAWRWENREARVDLRGAELEDADLRGVNLTNAKLQDSNLSGAKLDRANFFGAKMQRAALIGARLFGANLDGVNLSDGQLSRATLDSATLFGASLDRATLDRTRFFGSRLFDTTFHGTSLDRAKLGNTAISNIDFSKARALAKIRHLGPSSVCTRTLERTAAGLSGATPERRSEVESFLRGAGVSEIYLATFRRSLDMPPMLSAFISHSSDDKPFARKLYEDLQARGVRCWLDEKDMNLGDQILPTLQKGIQDNDRMLLCCSEKALTSSWVDFEIAVALEKGQAIGKQVLIPLLLDDYFFDGWTSGEAPLVRRLLAGDFRKRDKDLQVYPAVLDQLVRALKP